ncbi:MAG: DUF4956 domain-containing protein [Myxococcales bacterium]|nr:DUF4956 domain-containing protein [Myxococcales bacterium]
MNDLTALLSVPAGETSWEQAMLAVVVAFVLGQLVAYTYERTYEGMSYSRGFVQSMVLSPVVAATLMMAIGDNFARGLGVMGATALVRYRTTIRDPRDMVFMFASLAVGLAAGVRSYPSALFGAVAFCGVAALLQWSPFGRRRRFDGLLRFWLPRDGASGDEVRAVLGAHCLTFVLVALRDLAQGESLEYAYQVKLRTDSSHDRLVAGLERLNGIQGLTLLLEDSHTEL